jgi:hypothetical protein
MRKNKPNLKPNSVNKTKQNKREEFYYKYFITTLVIGVIHYYFFESHYLGSDFRYDLVVFWTPVVVGLILIVRYNILSMDWHDILPAIKKEKNIFYKIIYAPFLFIMHFMLSVLIFWIPSNIIWDSINKIESNKNDSKKYTLKVDNFHHSTGKGGSNQIQFIFKGKNENIKVSYQDIKPYFDQNPNDFQVIIEVKKGIWNYYVLQSWDIEVVPNPVTF